MEIETQLGYRTETGRKRRERTRYKLIEAAARLVAHQGADSATIDDFAREAKVARGTFYNYFPTREDLLEALWAHVGHVPFHRIQQAITVFDDPAKRIVATMHLVAHHADEDSIWGWLLLSMSGLSQVNVDLRAYPTPDLKLGLQSGRFSFNDLTSARDLVVSAVRAMLRARLEQRASDAYVADLARMLLLALGVREPEASELSMDPSPIT
ncbi:MULTISPECIES: TetR/AcrR family transcriptional regulator [unclassified Sphingomonas]|uniref:TetR/AcrR family transcriptional regulator n=1 Tax=unclassified Sphingomonas TaxID=196159 RepID=UPI0006F6A4E3|nr:MULTISPECIES: TetR/AcrR family transcriptional regulator [unclassified Sphingomonas]KRB95408.1 hypothetical protein ASE22_05825 [Sphingomonas sp. Root720]